MYRPNQDLIKSARNGEKPLVMIAANTKYKWSVVPIVEVIDDNFIKLEINGRRIKYSRWSVISPKSDAEPKVVINENHNKPVEFRDKLGRPAEVGQRVVVPSRERYNALEVGLIQDVRPRSCLIVDEITGEQIIRLSEFTTAQYVVID